ncbi:MULTISPECIES: GTP cyclohydrolase I FolE [Enterococcus]|uniref:GTP cyclohydrolase I FolE n=1 Tax=Enterococcus TaxID=1350 RepID=UPI000CF1450C|nr:GTP cyclohydrolase I FolE [Enterococcus faecium]EGP4846711.1 GTP cyclohydrolase I FolE [Enterococcus faecium]EGP4892450.1 GTP cyclohydrolase I FolE [Enterococcus faecium]EGP4915312.1 GTP cyclohydrolase I FolE [Enterococcus faecium]EGP4917792.1 GTP cyclohydrolase I FolE [Enterococcus faecium]EGP5343993.1 GTP cyclohydrolase I FolE [Enterococcus faecium]
MDDKNKILIQKAVYQILEAIGEDPNREGLRETPCRVAKMYEEIFSSLNEPEFKDYSLFNSCNDEDMVLIKDIQFYSICEHHLLPFFGKVHVAYIPDDQKIVGLSKILRLVNFCSKRPNVQERMTKMIAEQLITHVPNKGVAVAIEAEHLCIAMRGIKISNSQTQTFHYKGLFKEEIKWKNDFLNRINH